MSIEDMIRKYKKRVAHKTEVMNDYKESHDPELLNSVPIYEKEIAECELIISALELAKAKTEGRLVELPCKVGDTVFTFCWNIKNQKYEVCTGKVKNVRYDAADGSVMVSDGERFRFLGKTVFLTHEAAEKALEEQKKNDEGR